MFQRDYILRMIEMMGDLMRRVKELMDELGIIDTDDDEDEADFDEADFDEPSQPASEEELWDRFTQVDYQPEPKPEPKKK